MATTADEIIHRPKNFDYDSPAHEIVKGVVEIVIGLSFSIAEGIVVDFITGGINELIPGTEFITDAGAVGLLRFMGILIPDKYLKIGYVCSLIPLVKNFVSPATLDGARRIWLAWKAWPKKIA